MNFNQAVKWLRKGATVELEGWSLSNPVSLKLRKSNTEVWAVQWSPVLKRFDWFKFGSIPELREAYDHAEYTLMDTGDKVMKILPKHGMRACPFCKGEDLILSSNGVESDNMVCNTCGTEGPVGETIKEAFMLWQNREKRTDEKE